MKLKFLATLLWSPLYTGATIIWFCAETHLHSYQKLDCWYSIAISGLPCTVLSSLPCFPCLQLLHWHQRQWHRQWRRWISKDCAGACVCQTPNVTKLKSSTLPMPTGKAWWTGGFSPTQHPPGGDSYMDLISIAREVIHYVGKQQTKSVAMQSQSRVCYLHKWHSVKWG